MPPDDTPLMPPPGPDETARSERLANLVRRHIVDGGGSVSFARYMELALYAPGLGYYSGGRQPFGEAGDFTTAPEISEFFGRCIGRQVAQVLRALVKGGAAPRILEVGAGSGRLAVQVLDELRRLDMPAVEYRILELSADLQAWQRHAIEARSPAVSGQVAWLQELPERFCGVVIANELLDALPVHRINLLGESAREYRVAWADGFCWQQGPLASDLAPEVQWVRRHLASPAPDRYVTEVRPALGGWIGSLADRLETGMLLLSDYGYPAREYYHPQRNGGTLRAYYRHQARDDVLAWPGLQDLTAHVDFTAVAEHAQAAGLQVAGFTTQAQFLMATGLIDMLGDAELSPNRVDLLNQVKRLTLPGDMGETFKFMALTCGLDQPLLGFSNDQRHRL